MLRTFHDISRFTVGTIGEPGDRSFWIQARSGNVLIGLAVEKSQVAVLGERLAAMLKEIAAAHPLLPSPATEKDSLPLETPIFGEFRVGSIALFYDEDSGLIQIDFREISVRDEGDQDELFQVDSPLLDDLQIVRIFISRSQAKGFSERAALVVKAGRQPCPFCSLPINPDGHICSRANGYRR